MNSINPKKTTQLLAAIDEKPDLYGPFWICTFLIFGAIISSSFTTVMTRVFVDRNHSEVSYNYETIGYEFCIVYGFLFGFPAISTIILKLIGSDTNLVRVDVYVTIESLRIRIFL